MYGNMIGRTETGAAAQYFAYDPQHDDEAVLGFDSSNNLKERLLWNPAVVDQILAAESVSSLGSSGRSDWFLTDNHQSVVGVLTPTDVPWEHDFHHVRHLVRRIRQAAFGQSIELRSHWL